MTHMLGRVRGKRMNESCRLSSSCPPRDRRSGAHGVLRAGPFLGPATPPSGGGGGRGGAGARAVRVVTGAYEKLSGVPGRPKLLGDNFPGWGSSHPSLIDPHQCMRARFLFRGGQARGGGSAGTLKKEGPSLCVPSEGLSAFERQCRWSSLRPHLWRKGGGGAA